jgi:hypothetical protein
MSSAGAIGYEVRAAAGQILHHFGAVCFGFSDHSKETRTAVGNSEEFMEVEMRNGDLFLEWLARTFAFVVIVGPLIWYATEIVPPDPSYLVTALVSFVTGSVWMATIVFLLDRQIVMGLEKGGRRGYKTR